MIKNILWLTALITLSCFTANAQSDTTYDLGRITVKKEFTQTITIKGSDLERYQFSDLSDAINVWLYGTYTNLATLIYVIDGNIVNDVNAYSIYDIDEITLVQNSLVQVSGASPSQQMVLIKTRTKKPGDHGFEAAAQRSIINMANLDNVPNVKSKTSVYDQYYLSGYKNFTNASFGLSADYQQDAFPELTASSLSFFHPFYFDRIKLNGFGNAQLWKGTTVTFGINYAPQESNYSYQYTQQEPGNEGSSYLANFYSHVSQHLFNSNLALTSHIIKGLTNTLSGVYNHYNYFETDTSNTVLTSFGNPDNVTRQLGKAEEKSYNILLRDNLAYHARLGALDMDPSLNFSYRKYSDSLGQNLIAFQGASNNGTVVSESGTSSSGRFKLFLLTPSVDIYYKDIFNLQVGFVYNLNSGKDFLSTLKIERASPFLSTSLDVTKLWDAKDADLRIFGSFSRQNQLLDDPYTTLAGLGLGVASNSGTGSVSPGAFQSGLTYIYTGYNPYQAYNTYQAGAVLTLFSNFTINYSYEYRYNLTLVELSVPVAPNGIQYEYGYFNAKTIANRLGFTYNYYSNGFNWRTGLNFAESKLSVVNDPTLQAFYANYLSSGHRVSGGFTNRFNYKGVFAGIDFLYQFGDRPISLANAVPYGPGYVMPAHVNSLSLQNVYAGLQLRVKQLKYAEAFVNFRNLLQNNSSDITDNRRYYGLGIKVGF